MYCYFLKMEIDFSLGMIFLMKWNYQYYHGTSIWTVLFCSTFISTATTIQFNYVTGSANMNLYKVPTQRAEVLIDQEIFRTLLLFSVWCKSNAFFNNINTNAFIFNISTLNFTSRGLLSCKYWCQMSTIAKYCLIVIQQNFDF